jgi:hypothetical protein
MATRLRFAEPFIDAIVATSRTNRRSAKAPG